jgi:hypothetical protein
MAKKIVSLDRQRLAEHGVDLVKDGSQWMLVCQQCGHSWPVPVHIIPRDYWICPAHQCNIATRPPVRKPKPEPEPEEDLLEKAISEALANYNLYQRKMREAQTDEETAAFRAESERWLDEYLGHIDIRNLEANDGD